MQLECKLDQCNDKYPKLDKYETLLGPNVDNSEGNVMIFRVLCLSRHLQTEKAE